MNMWHLIGELIGSPKSPNNNVNDFALNFKDEI